MKSYDKISTIISYWHLNYVLPNKPFTGPFYMNIDFILNFLICFVFYRATTDSDSNSDVKMMCTYNLLVIFFTFI